MLENSATPASRASPRVRDTVRTVTASKGKERLLFHLNGVDVVRATRRAEDGGEAVSTSSSASSSRSSSTSGAPPAPAAPSSNGRTAARATGGSGAVSAPRSAAVQRSSKATPTPASPTVVDPRGSAGAAPSPGSDISVVEMAPSASSRRQRPVDARRSAARAKAAAGYPADHGTSNQSQQPSSVSSATPSPPPAGRSLLSPHQPAASAPSKLSRQTGPDGGAVHQRRFTNPLLNAKECGRKSGADTGNESNSFSLPKLPSNVASPTHPAVIATTEITLRVASPAGKIRAAASPNPQQSQQPKPLPTRTVSTKRSATAFTPSSAAPHARNGKPAAAAAPMNASSSAASPISIVLPPVTIHTQPPAPHATRVKSMERRSSHEADARANAQPGQYTIEEMEDDYMNNYMQLKGRGAHDDDGASRVKPSSPDVYAFSLPSAPPLVLLAQPSAAGQRQSHPPPSSADASPVSAPPRVSSATAGDVAYMNFMMDLDYDDLLGSSPVPNTVLRPPQSAKLPPRRAEGASFSRRASVPVGEMHGASHVLAAAPSPRRADERERGERSNSSSSPASAGDPSPTAHTPSRRSDSAVFSALEQMSSSFWGDMMLNDTAPVGVDSASGPRRGHGAAASDPEVLSDVSDGYGGFRSRHRSRRGSNSSTAHNASRSQSVVRSSSSGGAGAASAASRRAAPSTGMNGSADGMGVFDQSITGGAFNYSFGLRSSPTASVSKPAPLAAAASPPSPTQRRSRTDASARGAAAPHRHEDRRTVGTSSGVAPASAHSAPRSSRSSAQTEARLSSARHRSRSATRDAASSPAIRRSPRGATAGVALTALTSPDSSGELFGLNSVYGTATASNAPVPSSTSPTVKDGAPLPHAEAAPRNSDDSATRTQTSADALSVSPETFSPPSVQGPGPRLPLPMFTSTSPEPAENVSASRGLPDDDTANTAAGDGTSAELPSLSATTPTTRAHDAQLARTPSFLEEFGAGDGDSASFARALLMNVQASQRRIPQSPPVARRDDIASIDAPELDATVELVTGTARYAPAPAQRPSRLPPRPAVSKAARPRPPPLPQPPAATPTSRPSMSLLPVPDESSSLFTNNDNRTASYRRSAPGAATDATSPARRANALGAGGGGSGNADNTSANVDLTHTSPHAGTRTSAISRSAYDLLQRYDYESGAEASYLRLAETDRSAVNNAARDPRPPMDSSSSSSSSDGMGSMPSLLGRSEASRRIDRQAQAAASHSASPTAAAAAAAASVTNTSPTLSTPTSYSAAHKQQQQQQQQQQWHSPQAPQGPRVSSSSGGGGGDGADAQRDSTDAYPRHPSHGARPSQTSAFRPFSSNTNAIIGQWQYQQQQQQQQQLNHTRDPASPLSSTAPRVLSSTRIKHAEQDEEQKDEWVDQFLSSPSRDARPSEPLVQTVATTAMEEDDDVEDYASDLESRFSKFREDCINDDDDDDNNNGRERAAARERGSPQSPPSHQQQQQYHESRHADDAEDELDENFDQTSAEDSPSSPHSRKKRWYAYVVHEIRWTASPSLTPDERPLSRPLDSLLPDDDEGMEFVA